MYVYILYIYIYIYMYMYVYLEHLRSTCRAPLTRRLAQPAP